MQTLLKSKLGGGYSQLLLTARKTNNWMLQNIRPKIFLQNIVKSTELGHYGLQLQCNYSLKINLPMKDGAERLRRKRLDNVTSGVARGVRFAQGGHLKRAAIFS